MAKRNRNTTEFKKDRPNDGLVVRKSARLAAISLKSHAIKKKSILRPTKKLTRKQLEVIQRDTGAVLDPFQFCSPIHSTQQPFDSTSGQLATTCAANNSSSIDHNYAVIVNKLPFDTQYEVAADVNTNADQFSDFPDAIAAPEMMIDSDVRCNIANTLIHPSEMGFPVLDLLDVVFLNCLADRLHIDRQLVVETSQQIYYEMNEAMAFDGDDGWYECASYDGDMDVDTAEDIYLDFADADLQNYRRFWSSTVKPLTAGSA